MLDFGQRAPIQAFSNAKLLSVARARTRRAGGISARDMAAVFTWMRPNDLVWNYWVNNYLLGEEPTGVRHPGVERRQDEPARRAARPIPPHFRFNSLAHPGAMTVLGSPVDLSCK